MTSELGRADAAAKPGGYPLRWLAAIVLIGGALRT